MKTISGLPEFGADGDRDRDPGHDGEEDNPDGYTGEKNEEGGHGVDTFGWSGQSGWSMMTAMSVSTPATMKSQKEITRRPPGGWA